MDHRDNRLAAKSLHILHLVLSWKESFVQDSGVSLADRLKSSRKQANRKVLLLIEQLTSADQEHVFWLQFFPWALRKKPNEF